jgi:DNA primase large subunit
LETRIYSYCISPYQSYKGVASLSVLRYAKYPFLRDAAAFVSEQVDIQLGELGRDEFKPIVQRASQRVLQALTYRRVLTSSEKLTDYLCEVLSFPTAVAIVSAINDPQLARVYALSEAKAAYGNLRDEDPRTVLAISRELGIAAEPMQDTLSVFRLGVEDYLLFATSFHQGKWKLVNRSLSGGMVRVTQHELARILQEAIQRRICQKASAQIPLDELPGSIAAEVEEVRRTWEEIRESMGIRPVSVDDGTNRPPCVKRMLERLERSEHLSHSERFALTTYLANAGRTTDEILNLYSTSPDFNRTRTEYQVKHLAGQIGSRTRYKPPKCSTMKTQGICPGGDDVCEKIGHPLQYPLRLSGQRGGGEAR